MRTSEQIFELATALSKAQGEMKPAAKDATNPHFRSTYATLASVIDAIRAPLSKHGLAFTQVFSQDADGRYALTTRLMHSSGQWIEAHSLLNPVKQDPQGVGSASSYYKRYHLMALVGVASDDEDDDGNAACPPPQQRQAPRAEPMPQGEMPAPGPQKRKPSAAQLKRLFAIASNSNWKTEQVKAFCAAKWQVESSSDLTLEQYDWLCNTLPSGTFESAMATLTAEQGDLAL